MNVVPLRRGMKSTLRGRVRGCKRRFKYLFEVVKVVLLLPAGPASPTPVARNRLSSSSERRRSSARGRARGDRRRRRSRQRAHGVGIARREGGGRHHPRPADGEDRGQREVVRGVGGGHPARRRNRTSGNGPRRPSEPGPADGRGGEDLEVIEARRDRTLDLGGRGDPGMNGTPWCAAPLGDGLIETGRDEIGRPGVDGRVDLGGGGHGARSHGEARGDRRRRGSRRERPGCAR